MLSPLPTQTAVALWDAVLAAVRQVLRERGIREILTPVVVEETAIEPFIEPVPGGGAFLRTSPELWHKRLLAAQSGSIFEVATVFRGREHGAIHRPEFHLLEWYRLSDDPSEILHDVERLVDAAFGAAADVLRIPSKSRPPFETIGWLDAVEATTGIALSGDECCEALRQKVQREAPSLWTDPPPAEEPESAMLAAWTSFFSAVGDAKLDPWLVGRCVHLVDFPIPLAALSSVGPSCWTSRRRVARRVESYVDGVELCNGYDELRDPHEQTRRFQIVNGLRRAYAVDPLPLPAAFIAAMDAMPPSVGAALGLERLVMLAGDRAGVGDVLPFEGLA